MRCPLAVGFVAPCPLWGFFSGAPCLGFSLRLRPSPCFGFLSGASLHSQAPARARRGAPPLPVRAGAGTVSPAACRCLPTEGSASLRRGRCQAPAAPRRGALALRAPGAPEQLLRRRPPRPPTPRAPRAAPPPRDWGGAWARAASAAADRRRQSPGARRAAAADAGRRLPTSRAELPGGAVPSRRRGRHEDEPPRPSATGRGPEPAGAAVRHHRVPHHALVPGHAAGPQAGLRPGRARQLPQLGRQRHGQRHRRPRCRRRHRRGERPPWRRALQLGDRRRPLPLQEFPHRHLVLVRGGAQRAW